MLIYQVIEKIQKPGDNSKIIGYFTTKKAAEEAVEYYTKQNLKFGRNYLLLTIGAYDSFPDFEKAKALAKLTDREKAILGVYYD